MRQPADIDNAVKEHPLDELLFNLVVAGKSELLEELAKEIGKADIKTYNLSENLLRTINETLATRRQYNVLA